jgi:putative membrane protein
MTAASAFPPFQAHPEVWLLVVGLIALGLYVDRVIQPRAVAAGNAPISSHQKAWFWFGVVLLWVASDWPIHDIAELRLYSVHMFQHMIFTVVLPPVFLLSVPEWLARLVLGHGRFKTCVYWLARPVPAAVLFNVMAAITHWNAVVNLSVSNGPFHYLMHTLFVVTGLLAWSLICGPLPELQLSDPGKMIYIFLMSVIPTVPAAFLVASDSLLYKAYAHVPRLWIATPIEDQQFAGVVMKLIEGFYLWSVIFVLFMRWMRQGLSDQQYRGRLIPSGTSPRAADPTGAETGSGLPTEAPGGERRQDDPPRGQDEPGPRVHVLAVGERADHDVAERGGGQRLGDHP